jgi:hypothetical protein
MLVFSSCTTAASHCEAVKPHQCQRSGPPDNRACSSAKMNHFHPLYIMYLYLEQHPKLFRAFFLGKSRELKRGDCIYRITPQISYNLSHGRLSSPIYLYPSSAEFPKPFAPSAPLTPGPNFGRNTS